MNDSTRLKMIADTYGTPLDPFSKKISQFLHFQTLISLSLTSFKINLLQRETFLLCDTWFLVSVCVAITYKMNFFLNRYVRLCDKICFIYKQTKIYLLPPHFFCHSVNIKSSLWHYLYQGSYAFIITLVQPIPASSLKKMNPH